MQTLERSARIIFRFGLAMVGGALFGLSIVAGQMAIIASGTFPPDFPPLRPILTTQRILLTHFPIMFVGGIVFAIAGYYMRRGSVVANRVATVNALCGYLWTISYMLSASQLMNSNDEFSEFSELGRTAMVWGSLTFGTLICAAFPTYLLYVLKSPPKRAVS